MLRAQMTVDARPVTVKSDQLNRKVHTGFVRDGTLAMWKQVGKKDGKQSDDLRNITVGKCQQTSCLFM